MDSRKILRLFCEHASKTAKRHGIDVDIARTLRIEVKELLGGLGKTRTFWRFKTPESYEVIWHRLRPIRKFFYNKAFCGPLLSETIPDDVCDTILQSLVDTGAELILHKPCYAEKKKEYDKYVNALNKRIAVLKNDDPNWPKTKKLELEHMRKECEIAYTNFHSSNEIEIPFVPKGITSFEEVQIWCDLND